MKYVKMLSLAMLAVAIPMVLATAASATTVNEGATPTIVAKSSPWEIHPGSGTPFLTIKCGSSTLEAKVESHGAGVTVKAGIVKWELKECGNDTFTLFKPGSLEIHTATEAADGNGTVTLNEFELRVHTSEGPVCTFKGLGIHFGTLTGGTPAKIDIGSTSIPATGFLCPSTGIWTGNYTITSPSTLTVE